MKTLYKSILTCMVSSPKNPFARWFAARNDFQPKTFLAIAIGAFLLAADPNRTIAQSITVPNFSFESPTAPSIYPYVNTSVDFWQKAPEPAYYGPAIGTSF